MNKVFQNRKSERGITMTEYLIILGVVAIGAILIFTLFGTQIKETTLRAIASLSGEERTSATAIDNTATATTEAETKKGTADFDDQLPQ